MKWHGLEKGEDEDERGFEMEAQTPQQSVIDLPNDVDRVLRDYESAWAARDAEALANLFTPDGFVLRPGSSARPRSGRDPGRRTGALAARWS